jgi:hypothetical protein
MSYEDTNCPCGGKKERETLICDQCREYFSAAIELAAMDDPRLPFEARRGSAIRLLSMARRRKSRTELGLAYQL